jgi:uncharacterized protein (DUF1778 family)
MPKSERLEIRLTTQERAALEQFAALSNQTMSETIRSLLRAALHVITDQPEATQPTAEAVA